MYVLTIVMFSRAASLLWILIWYFFLTSAILAS
jgi:hypothetical protein